MAARKKTTRKVEEKTDDAPVEAEAARPAALIEAPDSLIPGSNFASRYAARMNVRG